MLNQEQKEFLTETVDRTIGICRKEVDLELALLRNQITSKHFSEEEVELIATRAAQKAKELTKKELIDDAKMEIANGSISILKNAMKIISLTIVGLAFYLGNKKWPWM